jgi:hypothetical protein
MVMSIIQGCYLEPVWYLPRDASLFVSKNGSQTLENTVITLR